MTQDECYKLISVLFTSYPTAKVSQRNAEAFASALADLPADVAAQAIDRLRRTMVFLPGISQIREAAAEVVLGPKRSGEDAYRILLETIRKVGRYEVPTFTDPHLQRALGVWGSWIDACNSPSEDPGGRARFIELYEQGVNAERDDVVSGIPLPTPRVGKPEYLLPEPKRVKP